MTLTTFDFITQIIASFAVVASLIFVGVQIRYQVHEQRQQRIHNRTMSAAPFCQILTHRPEHITIFLRGLESFSSLNAEERLLFDLAMVMLTRSVILNYRQYIDGDMEKENWHDAQEFVKPLFGSPGGVEWFKAHKKRVFGAAHIAVEPFIDTQEGRDAYKDWRAHFLATETQDHDAANDVRDGA